MMHRNWNEHVHVKPACDKVRKSFNGAAYLNECQVECSGQSLVDSDVADLIGCLERVLHNAPSERISDTAETKFRIPRPNPESSFRSQTSSSSVCNSATRSTFQKHVGENCGGRSDTNDENVFTVLTLDVGINELTSKAVEYIVSFLERSSSSVSLRVLKMYKNFIDDAGAHLLARYIRNQRRPLEELHLSHNKISDNGATAILVALSESCRTPVPASTAGQQFSLYTYPRFDEGMKRFLPTWIRLEYNSIASPDACVEKWSKKHQSIRPDMPKDIKRIVCYANQSNGRNHCSAARCINSSSDYSALAHLYLIHHQFNPARSSSSAHASPAKFGSRGGRWAADGPPWNSARNTKNMEVYRVAQKHQPKPTNRILPHVPNQFHTRRGSTYIESTSSRLSVTSNAPSIHKVETRIPYKSSSCGTKVEMDSKHTDSQSASLLGQHPNSIGKTSESADLSKLSESKNTIQSSPDGAPKYQQTKFSDSTCPSIPTQTTGFPPQSSTYTPVSPPVDGPFPKDLISAADNNFVVEKSIPPLPAMMDSNNTYVMSQSGTPSFFPRPNSIDSRFVLPSVPSLSESISPSKSKYHFPLYVFVDGGALLQMHDFRRSGYVQPFSLPGLWLLCENNVLCHRVEYPNESDHIIVMICKAAVDELRELKQRNPIITDRVNANEAQYMHPLWQKYGVIEKLPGFGSSKTNMTLSSEEVQQGTSMSLSRAVIEIIGFTFLWCQHIAQHLGEGNTNPSPATVVLTADPNMVLYHRWLVNRDMANRRGVICMNVDTLNRMLRCRWSKLCDFLLQVPSDMSSQCEVDNDEVNKRAEAAGLKGVICASAMQLLMEQHAMNEFPIPTDDRLPPTSNSEILYNRNPPKHILPFVRDNGPRQYDDLPNNIHISERDGGQRRASIVSDELLSLYYPTQPPIPSMDNLDGAILDSFDLHNVGSVPRPTNQFSNPISVEEVDRLQIAAARKEYMSREGPRDLRQVGSRFGTLCNSSSDNMVPPHNFENLQSGPSQSTFYPSTSPRYTNVGRRSFFAGPEMDFREYPNNDLRRLSFPMQNTDMGFDRMDGVRETEINRVFNRASFHGQPPYFDGNECHVYRSELSNATNLVKQLQSYAEARLGGNVSVQNDERRLLKMSKESIEKWDTLLSQTPPSDAKWKKNNL